MARPVSVQSGQSVEEEIDLNMESSIDGTYLEELTTYFSSSEDDDFDINLEELFPEKSNADTDISLKNSLQLISQINPGLLNLYIGMSKTISDTIIHDVNGAMLPLIKSMRTVKKEILKLISLWFSHSTYPKEVLENFIPHLLTRVLSDYQSCPEPSAREPEVLLTMTTIVNKLQEQITPEVPKIFDHVFQCTLSMINKDFEEFPEHRTNFFLLLQAVVNHCFPALLEFPPDSFELVLHSIIWAFKHTMRNVADIGLQILYQLLQNIGKDEGTSQAFYQTYYTDILQHLFSVVTDASHTAGLSMQANILAYMFSIVESGKITLPLNPAVQGDTIPNLVYVQQFVADLLKRAFGHLSDSQIKITVSGFFNLDQDIPAFKEHLRDFLVQIRNKDVEKTSANEEEMFFQSNKGVDKPSANEEEMFFQSMPMLIQSQSISKLSSTSSSSSSLFAGSKARYEGFGWKSRNIKVSESMTDHNKFSTTTRENERDKSPSEYFPQLSDSSLASEGEETLLTLWRKTCGVLKCERCSKKEDDLPTVRFVNVQCYHFYCINCIKFLFSPANNIKPVICIKCGKQLKKYHNRYLD